MPAVASLEDLKVAQKDLHEAKDLDQLKAAFKKWRRIGSGCRFRQLCNYRAFYRAYPQILRTVSAKSKELLHTIVPPAAKM